MVVSQLPSFHADCIRRSYLCVGIKVRGKSAGSSSTSCAFYVQSFNPRENSQILCLSYFSGVKSVKKTIHRNSAIFNEFV